MRALSRFLIPACLALGSRPGRLAFKWGIVSHCFTFHSVPRRPFAKHAHGAPVAFVFDCSSHPFPKKTPQNMPKMQKTTGSILLHPPAQPFKKCPKSRNNSRHPVISPRSFGHSFSYTCRKSTIYSPTARFARHSARSSVVRPLSSFSRSCEKSTVYSRIPFPLHCTRSPVVRLRPSRGGGVEAELNLTLLHCLSRPVGLVRPSDHRYLHFTDELQCQEAGY
jgi:hypothetical protein